MLANNNKPVRKMPLIVKDSDLERFWKRVKKSEEQNGCWEWQGRIKGGYGQFKFGRVVYVTHRVSYFIHNKIDPLNNLCCHTCDNRKCVNPNHIFLGSQNDNYQDAVKKKRATVLSGVNHMSAKLNDEKVKEMIEDYAKGGVTQYQLGKRYGVSGNYIDLVLKGKVWKHVVVERIKTQNPLVIKLTERKVKAILKDHFINGVPYADLSNKYGVSRSVICSIANGNAWIGVSRIIDGVNCVHTEKQSSSKLNSSIVSEIRRRHLCGDITYQELAEIFDVVKESIRRIIKRDTWKNIA